MEGVQLAGSVAPSIGTCYRRVESVGELWRQVQDGECGTVVGPPGERKSNYGCERVI